MTIARIAGIRIRIHFVVLLLCLGYIYLGLAAEIMLILSSVLLHELAHAIIALRLGLRISEIELLPFGGQAKVEDFTGIDPDREIYVAIAGPVMSLVLAGMFYLFYYQSNYMNELTQLFITINLLLGVFNLLPALPLDGGRILRALLSKIMGYKKATARTAAMGKAIAVAIAGYAGYMIYYEQSGHNILIVAVLLFWAAHREAKLLAYAFMRYLINKKDELAKKGMLSSRQIVAREDTLVKKIAEATRPAYYTIVVIVDDQHQIIGMRTEAELIEALFERGPLIALKDC
ncbi:MAG: M50 family metallopeptidase [Bacillota bacterium]|nr:M50 family metallopeptidase [Bacillota bacterium]